MTNLFL